MFTVRKISENISCTEFDLWKQLSQQALPLEDVSVDTIMKCATLLSSNSLANEWIWFTKEWIWEGG